MVEIVTGQAGALAKAMLLDQFAVGSAAARYSECLSRRSQTIPSCDTRNFRPVRHSAYPIDARSALETIELGQLRQGAVDFP